MIPVGPQRQLRGAPQVDRPATHTDQFRQIIERDHRPACSGTLPVQKTRQRDFARRVTQLEQRERAHAEACQASGPRVAGGVVGRNGGSGKDELTRQAPIIHCPTHMIPDRRLQLPFVDQPRHATDQDPGRLEAGQAPRYIVNIQPRFTRGDLPRRGGLPAGPWALDNHRSSSLQPLGQFAVDDSGVIGHACTCMDWVGGSWSEDPNGQESDGEGASGGNGVK